MNLGNSEIVIKVRRLLHKTFPTTCTSCNTSVQGNVSANKSIHVQSTCLLTCSAKNLQANWEMFQAHGLQSTRTVDLIPVAIEPMHPHTRTAFKSPALLNAKLIYKLYCRVMGKVSALFG